MKVRILPSALSDLSEGYDFYEDCEQGVGRHFLSCLFEDIDSLQSFAGIHPIRHGCHRLLSKRFPFAIYYLVEGDAAIVRRVLDARRDPKWIRKQFK